MKTQHAHLLLLKICYSLTAVKALTVLSITSHCLAGQSVSVWSEWKSCPSPGTKDCPETGRIRTREVIKGNHTQIKRKCLKSGI